MSQNLTYTDVETQIMCSLFNFQDPKKSKKSKKSKKQTADNHKLYKSSWYENDADIEDEYIFNKGDSDKSIKPLISYTKHYIERLKTRHCVEGEKMYTVIKQNTAVTTYPVKKHLDLDLDTQSKNLFSHRRGHYWH
jgi:hypothetical protein